LLARVFVYTNKGGKEIEGFCGSEPVEAFGGGHCGHFVVNNKWRLGVENGNNKRGDGLNIIVAIDGEPRMQKYYVVTGDNVAKS